MDRNWVVLGVSLMLWGLLFFWILRVERRVREVGVAVDEDRLPSILRGHFRSIHRRIGAAT